MLNIVSLCDQLHMDKPCSNNETRLVLKNIVYEKECYSFIKPRYSSIGLIFGWWPLKLRNIVS